MPTTNGRVAIHLVGPWLAELPASAASAAMFAGALPSAPPQRRRLVQP